MIMDWFYLLLHRSTLILYVQDITLVTTSWTHSMYMISEIVFFIIKTVGSAAYPA